MQVLVANCTRPTVHIREHTYEPPLHVKIDMTLRGSMQDGVKPRETHHDAERFFCMPLGVLEVQ